VCRNVRIFGGGAKSAVEVLDPLVPRRFFTMEGPGGGGAAVDVKRRRNDK
jgi:hypothetical protein